MAARFSVLAINSAVSYWHSRPLISGMSWAYGDCYVIGGDELNTRVLVRENNDLECP